MIDNREENRTAGIAEAKEQIPVIQIVLGLKTPDRMESAKLRELMSAAGELRCRKPERRLTSSDS